MQTILVVNESEKAAYIKTNRILSKYLKQIGQRTYMSSISNEGMEDLQKELVAARSRYMSVVAYSVKKNHLSEIVFSVGNTQQFDMDTGTYAFRTKTVPLKLMFKNESPLFQYFQSLLKISALLHDIGKANDAFQAKLYRHIQGKSGISFEYLRHDAMGFLILSYIKELNQECSYSELLSLIADPNSYSAVKDIFSVIHKAEHSQKDALINELVLQHSLINKNFKEKNVTAGYVALYEKLNNYFVKNSSSDEKSQTVSKTELSEFTWYALLFLVLTHHKLPYDNTVSDPAASEEKNYFSANYQRAKYYINQQAKIEVKEGKSKKEIIDYNCFVFSNGLPIDNKNYQQRLQQEIDSCLKIQESIEVSEYSLVDLFALLTHFVRPFLVFADHTGSHLKKDVLIKDRDPKSNEIIANTYSSDKLTLKGDSLNTHLSSVANLTRQVSNLAYFSMKHKDNGDFLPRMPLSKMTKLNQMLISNTNDKYDWQNQAFSLIKSKKGSPFFVNVIAETGSGKTIASAKIAAALGDSLRYVYCLGLRSLTLQTSRSYAEDIGIKNVATIIGDKLVVEVDEQMAKDNKPFATGSETMNTQDDPFEFVEYNGIVNGEWLNYFNDKKACTTIDSALNDNAVKLIDSPIVVATIDQLIAVTKLDTISAAKLYLRLLSSDLVLDEIDNYSLVQIKQIARLVYLTALFGNSVICMSATLNSSIATSLATSFAKGIHDHNLIMNTNKAPMLANVSNRIPPELMEIRYEPIALLDTSSIFKTINTYNSKFALEAMRGAIKNNVRIKPLNGPELKSIFEEITRECFELHQNTKKAVATTENTCDVSIGFVKFNSVKNARKYAKYLMETTAVPSDTLLSVICYHSKYSLMELTQIDKILNNLVNRKSLKNGYELSSVAMDQIIDPLIKSHGKPVSNICIVIVTTNILETGRDHDYDFCVIEPNSYRSLVQGAGRVYRHRKIADNHSVVMLDRTIDDIIKKKEKPWELHSNNFSTPLARNLRKQHPYDTSFKLLDTSNASQAFNIEKSAPVLSADALQHAAIDKTTSPPLITAVDQLIVDKYLINRIPVIRQSRRPTTGGAIPTANMLLPINQIAPTDYFEYGTYFCKEVYLRRFREGRMDIRLSHVENINEDSKSLVWQALPNMGYGDATVGVSEDVVNVVEPSRALILSVYQSTAAKRERKDKNTKPMIYSTVKSLIEGELASLTLSQQAALLTYNMPIFANNDGTIAHYHALLGFNDKDANYEKD